MECFKAVVIDLVGAVLHFLHTRCEVFQMPEKGQVGELHLFGECSFLVGGITHVRGQGLG